MQRTIATLALALAGCTSDPVIRSAHHYDIARMVPDCSNKDAQVRYLNSMLENTITEPNPRSYRATVLNLIWEIREKCQ